MLMVDLGSKLKTLRMNAHLTQLQVAQRIGVSKAMISSYELSTRYPSYEILIKLASLFRVSADYLLGLEKAKTISVDGLNSEQISILNSIIKEFQSR
jgi:transcriptional regulator with XRE-family HTH domain